MQYVRPQTLNDIASRILGGAMLPFMVKEFMDEWRKLPSPEKLEQEPAHINAHADAFLAAMAECLATRMGVAAPEWANHETRFLETPSFWGRSSSMRELMLVETPAAFRRRLIFCGRILAEAE